MPERNRYVNFKPKLYDVYVSYMYVTLADVMAIVAGCHIM